MRDQHGCDRPPGAKSGTRVDEIEPIVLMRLLEPPQFGDHVRDLALDLHEDQSDIEAAVGRLTAAGLATREGDFASPTRAAVRFNELWPI